MDSAARPTADATTNPERATATPRVDGGVSPDTVDSFVRLLGQNQRRIFLFVMSMVPDWNEAEEIMQETNLVLWREFGRFQPGTNFSAWACKVALHQVLAWRKRVRRDRLEFSPTFLEHVADEASAGSEALEERSQRLARCIERLPEDHRQMLRLRYGDGLAIETMSRRLERSEDAVYRALSRIRRVLHECVTRSFLMEGRS
jgi:RNA polymerase sigma-70 factor (ECF subfamily)